MKFLITTLLLFLTTFSSYADLRRQDGGDVPVGSTINTAGSCPAGFLLNNGGNISRTTYPKLFSTIGTTYGVGDGSTTFTLPNYIPNIRSFASGSGTYTPTGGTRYIHVRMVGAGGGGGGSGTSNPTGTAGGATTFGTLTANGGTASNGIGDSGGGTGGTATIGTGFIGSSWPGQPGGDSSTGTTIRDGSRGGGSVLFGGSGPNGGGTTTIGASGKPAIANTGGGGGGAGMGTSGSNAGCGGASGASIDVISSLLLNSYSYSVGAGGSGGSAGSSGSAGGAGGSGYIEVTEYNSLGNCIKY